MKKILTSLLVLSLLLLAVGCGSTTYKNDVTVNTLADTAITALNDGKEYSTAEADFLDSYFTKSDYVTESVCLVLPYR